MDKNVEHGLHVVHSVVFQITHIHTYTHCDELPCSCEQRRAQTNTTGVDYRRRLSSPSI